MAIGESTVIFMVLFIFVTIIYFKANKLVGSILFFAIGMTTLVLDDDINRYFSVLFVLCSIVMIAYSVMTPELGKHQNINNSSRH